MLFSSFDESIIFVLGLRTSSEDEDGFATAMSSFCNADLPVDQASKVYSFVLFFCCKVEFFMLCSHTLDAFLI